MAANQYSRLRKVTYSDRYDKGTDTAVSTLSSSIVSDPVFGANVSSYRTRILNRQSATTSLSVSGVKVIQGSDGYASQEVLNKDDARYYKRSESKYNLGMYTAVPSPPTLSTTRCDSQARMKFISNAVQAQGQLAGLVALGEARETLHLIRGRTKQLLPLVTRHVKQVTDHAISATRKMPRKKRIARATKIVADSWLENVFGWQPLINDIEDAMIASYRIANERRPSKYIQGKGFDSAIISTTEHVQNMTYYSVTRNFVSRDTNEIKYYGSVLLESGLTGASKMLGLSWSDVIPAVWELIPYSFVVDYFTNVGSIVEAAAFNRSSLAWVNKGSYLRRTLTLVSADMNPAVQVSPLIQGQRSFVPPSNFAIERFSKTRSAYLGSLIPSLVFEVPGFKQKLNLAALLSSKLSCARRIATHLR